MSLNSVRPVTGLTIEVLLIDNGSKDKTREVIERFVSSSAYRSHSIYEPVPGKSRGLNRAMKLAQGRVLLFTDDDVRFPTAWIERMSAPILEQKADLVQGGIVWAPDLLALNVPSYIPAVITSTEHKGPKELSQALIGANMALSRVVYQTLGDFDVELGPGALGLAEETLYGWRALAAGFRKHNELEVKVEHHFNASRLNRNGILGIAEKKGRSGAYIDYHYRNVSIRFLYAKWSWTCIKNFARSALTPISWSRHRIPPPWKYSYCATQAYLRQMISERRRSRKSALGEVPSPICHTDTTAAAGQRSASLQS